MLNVHCTTAFTADLYQCSWGLNLSLSHYYKTVLLFNWHLGILYTVPWFTLHIIYLFFPSCLSSCKEKLGLHCSSDYVMQVFITHFLVCSGNLLQGFWCKQFVVTKHDAHNKRCYFFGRHRLWVRACVLYINKLAQKFCVHVHAYIWIYNALIGPPNQLQ